MHTLSDVISIYSLNCVPASVCVCACRCRRASVSFLIIYNIITMSTPISCLNKFSTRVGYARLGRFSPISDFSLSCVCSCICTNVKNYLMCSHFLALIYGKVLIIVPNQLVFKCSRWTLRIQKRWVARALTFDLHSKLLCTFTYIWARFFFIFSFFSFFLSLLLLYWRYKTAVTPMMDNV